LCALCTMGVICVVSNSFSILIQYMQVTLSKKMSKGGRSTSSSR
jgi:hypothetical protein